MMPAKNIINFDDFILQNNYDIDCYLLERICINFVYDVRISYMPVESVEDTINYICNTNNFIYENTIAIYYCNRNFCKILIIPNHTLDTIINIINRFLQLKAFI